MRMYFDNTNIFTKNNDDRDHFAPIQCVLHLRKDGTEGHLVKQVISHQKRNGITQYRSWWLRETKQATWRPVLNLMQIPGLTQQYRDNRKANLFKTENGNRKTEIGKRTTENGKRKTENGKRKLSLQGRLSDAFSV